MQEESEDEKQQQTYTFENLFIPPDLKENDNYSRYQLRNWWVVLNAYADKPFMQRLNLFERALKCLPNSYKLWLYFLKECIENLKNSRTFLSRKYKLVENIFEKCMVYMHKMPVIWLLFTDFLISHY